MVEQDRVPVPRAAAVWRLRAAHEGPPRHLPLLPLPHHHAARRQDPTRPSSHHQPQRAVPAAGDPGVPRRRGLWPRSARLLAAGLASAEHADPAAPARQRIREVEQAIADHQASLAKLHDDLDLPVAAMDVLAPSLDRLPVFGERLWELPQRELRRLFDSLDLMVTYDHRRRVGSVRITLASDADRVRGSGPCPGRDSNARPTA